MKNFDMKVFVTALAAVVVGVVFVAPMVEQKKTDMATGGGSTTPGEYTE